MTLEVGNIPFRDDRSDGNVNVRHLAVYIIQKGGRHFVSCDGYMNAQLPLPSKKKDDALRKARRFIKNNNGSGYRRPIPCAVRGTRGFKRPRLVVRKRLDD